MNDSLKTNRPTLKIACILDNFSYNCFKYECNLIQLHLDTWRETLLREMPDYVLVESAWRGYEKSWNKKIVKLNESRDKNLKALITFCKRVKIPTIFWNKEDPVHFDNFIDAAKMFDFVFTTSEECISKYKKLLKHNNVFLLPFAAQPKLHNPVEKDKDHLGEIAFAGTWYRHKYPARRESLNYLLSSAIKYDLHIYDRTYNTKHPYKKTYEFPEKFAPFIKGCLEYTEMVEAYKKYDIFLNVNTITDSNSMFSRRVLELLACGTPVISNYAKSIERFFPGIVQLASNLQETQIHIDKIMSDKDYKDRISLLGQREILNHHTYSHRMNTILDSIGYLDICPKKPGVSIISIISDISSLDSVLKNFKKQTFKDKELTLVFTTQIADAKNHVKKLTPKENVHIISSNGKRSFKDNLSLAVDKCTFDYLSLFDGRSYYGPNFLLDLMHTFEYSKTLITGKCSFYSYDVNMNLNLINAGEEYTFSKSLSPTAMIFNKNLLWDIKSHSGKYNNFWSDFFSNCLKFNIPLYSSDRFNYLELPENIQSFLGPNRLSILNNFISDITV